MKWKIAGAPGAWGIEDPNNPNNPPYKKVLDDASQAGYKGLELGPFGYMPLELSILKKELKDRGLSIVAGTIYDDLVDESNFESVLAKVHKTCQLISQLPKPEQLEGQRYETPYLVIIDAVKEERNAEAGHPENAKRLSEKRWNLLTNHILEMSRIAKTYGIRGVIHPHAGGYIEFEDEIQKIMDDLNAEEVGLCLDTGHLFYSKMKPDDYIRQYQERLDYVHFKDINHATYEKIMNDGMGFFEGCNIGVMCPIGSGCVDYKGIRQALSDIGYNGWITIEQERDPLACHQSMDDAIKSIRYLNKEGYNL
ncbi:sugar phosphate isomerase/epimerase family protein [Vallitalea okinawensis]|uniref:sugar phosphate isomerase/epimerase family protein n=1 Tax=Vallitalea okinawensis TaxID=2078660 RepID=UPI000CFAB1A7|nr:TIM barrel protein [Vallitalea okinawensis]